VLAHYIHSDTNNSSNVADITEQVVTQVCNNDQQLQPTTALEPPLPELDIDEPTPSEPDSEDMAWI
jgi:hypothetical protein